jgi:glycosyltransferase involved in cell wall biosynthesis
VRRVVHVTAGLAARTGGVAASVVGYCRALDRCGIESTVLTTDLPGPATAPASRRVESHELPEGAADLDIRIFPAQHPHRLAYSPKLARALRLELQHADLVHVHSLWLYPTFTAAREARRADVPYVVSPHGTLDPALRGRGRARKAATQFLWQRQMLAHAAAIHFTTEAEARLARDLTGDRPTIVAPNPVDCARLAELPPNEEFRAAYLDGTTGPVVLNLGRISAHKQLDILVKAFALASAGTSARLVVAGPDDEGVTADLEALAARLGIADRVAFPGPLYGHAKLAALAAADIWALPSRSENFGVAVAEALAAGIATVVSPGVNVAEELATAGAAIVADATPAAFAAALTRLLDDARLRGRIAERGRAHARRYDLSCAGALLAAGYERALPVRPVALRPAEAIAHD